MVLGEGGVGDVAFSVSAGFGEEAFEGVEAFAVVDEAGDVDLGADEVADGAAVVVEGRGEEEVHEGGAVSPVI